jgi:hypothetical protein
LPALGFDIHRSRETSMPCEVLAESRLEVRVC